MNDAGRHLLALVNDLLDLAKVEAGKMELRPEPFDVGELVGRAISTVQPLAERKRIALSGTSQDVTSTRGRSAIGATSHR